MMPWFFSAPWVPKFGGERRKFGEWKHQVEAMLRAQPMSNAQQADFVFSALEGEARREIALLDDSQRNSGQKILRSLDAVYGESTSNARIRAAFFKCRQAPEEGIGAFLLRLRECHARWRQAEPAAAGGDDDLLLDQFVLALRDGPVRMELQRHLRRQPQQTFKVIAAEARALEEELGESTDTVTANVIQLHSASTGTAGDRPKRETTMEEWKESLRQELQQTVADQVKALGTQLLEELHHHRPTASSTAAARNDHPPSMSVPEAIAVPAASRPPRVPSSYRWDEQGRPICLDCGMAGHIQRHCPQRQRQRQLGFQNPPPPRAGRWGR